MKRMRKFSSLLSVLLIILLLISLPVSAQDASGTLSNGQTWNFDSATGTLSITGTGAIPDYPFPGIIQENQTPWKDFAGEIKTVVLGEGITSTGKYTFYKLSNLTDVQLPSTLQIIDSYAFSNTAITGIAFPDSLTTVGEYAFAYCKQLKELRFPASVKEMGDHVFNYCTSYANVYFYGDLPDTPGMNYTGSHLNIFYPKGNETWAEGNLPRWDGDIVIRPFSDCINDHTYGGWINVEEPTAEKEGLKQRVCGICKHIDYATIPKLENNSPATTPATQPATQPPTQPATQPPTQPATEPPTQPTTAPVTEPATEPASSPATEPAETEPAPTQQAPSSPTSHEPVPEKDHTGLIIGIVLGVVLIGGGAAWYFLRKRK